MTKLREIQPTRVGLFCPFCDAPLSRMTVLFDPVTHRCPCHRCNISWTSTAYIDAREVVYADEAGVESMQCEPLFTWEHSIL